MFGFSHRLLDAASGGKGRVAIHAEDKPGEAGAADAGLQRTAGTSGQDRRVGQGSLRRELLPGC